jgi:TonB dependent receptor/Carboxypeptidase regulatory-like domain/TonB-dependent Receptor Plug Domain
MKKLRSFPILSLLCIFYFLSIPSVPATIFGTVRGIVHDPQHLPVQDATVTLKASGSGFTQTQHTDNLGEFTFPAIPIGDYTVAVSHPGFADQTQSVTVHSDTSPILHFGLDLAGTSQTEVVSGAPVTAGVQSVTPTTVVSRADIQSTPGADQTNSMAAITDFVPGAYMVHDMLHIRGGHQYTWLVDGVPVPNTNIATNLGPQFDPKDADYIEVQRGSYDAEYGDRTYGVFNVVPRTGFERDRECDLVFTLGSFFQTNDQLSCGSHSQRLAWYASFTGDRSDLGLMTPSAAIDHDSENGTGGFGSLIYNLGSNDQLRLVASLRRDFYQMPVDPAVVATGLTQLDAQHEADSFINFSWVHTFSHQGILTVSPFYHFNSANYDSNPSDFPNAITDDHSSNYAGAQITASASIARNSLSGGFYGFNEWDNQFFGVLFNDGSNVPINDTERLTGSVVAIYADDRFELNQWFSVSAGVRETRFSSSDGVSETVASPRTGLALRIPKLNWVARAFYGQFYQAPPLSSVTGPLLGIVNTPGSGANPQQFIPLDGERDTEYQIGLDMPYKGWALDLDTFRTRATNFLDHGNVNYVFNGNPVTTNIFLPLTTQEALIQGWEVTLRSPRIAHRGQLHLAYSNQLAQFTGCITGGLTNFLCQVGFAPLDHDQRNTLNLGFDVALPRNAFLSGNYYYGSGFTNGDPPPDYLAAHSTLDLSIGKDFAERFSVSVTALNIADSHLLIDNSFTFGGVHWNNPRQLYAEFRYRFKY